MSDADLIWNGNWAWSLPLIVLTVVLHVICLGVINTGVVRALQSVTSRRHFITAFALVMGVTTLLSTILFGLEAAIWAFAYLRLGAIADAASAMIYSLSAMTAYGHAELYLARHWQLMGALEALNGLLLFGLTTAFLYGHIQRVWLTQDSRWTVKNGP
ncbi:MAG: hypothetical protein JSR36_04715 [Proteobacteria bacterium]|nr:hypothetical protein [Pseudomonadota bacterium]